MKRASKALPPGLLGLVTVALATALGPSAAAQAPEGAFQLEPPGLLQREGREDSPRGPYAGDASADVMESALLDAYLSLDPIGVVALLRSSITAVYEGYCALTNLIPPEDGFDALGLTLGIGCLVGSTTLFVLSAIRLGGLSEDEDGREAYQRFRAARLRDEADAEAFSDALAYLEEAAEDAHVERLVSVVLGAAALVAGGVLTGLTAAGLVDGATGTAIAAGCAIVGGLSLLPLGFEAPAEAALRRVRAHRR